MKFRTSVRDCRNGAEMKMDIFGDCQIYFSWVALKQILVDANFKFRKRKSRSQSGACYSDGGLWATEESRRRLKGGGLIVAACATLPNLSKLTNVFVKI